MSLLKKTLHPALKYSIFKVEHFLSEMAQSQAQTHIDNRGREVRGVVYVRVLCMLRQPRSKGWLCRVALGLEIRVGLPLIMARDTSGDDFMHLKHPTSNIK
jgi:hypothetical protein